MEWSQFNQQTKEEKTRNDNKKQMECWNYHSGGINGTLIDGIKLTQSTITEIFFLVLKVIGAAWCGKWYFNYAKFI